MPPVLEYVGVYLLALALSYGAVVVVMRWNGRAAR